MILTANDIAELRGLAEGEMVDSCRISIPSEGVGDFDEDSMQYDPAGPDEVVYAGKCAFETKTAADDGVTVAEQDLVVQQVILKLPVAGTSGVRRNQTVTVTDLAEVSDPALADHTYRVASLGSLKTTATKRTVVLEVLT